MVTPKKTIWIGPTDPPNLDGPLAFFTKTGVFCPIKTTAEGKSTKNRRKHSQKVSFNIPSLGSSKARARWWCLSRGASYHSRRPCILVLQPTISVTRAARWRSRQPGGQGDRRPTAPPLRRAPTSRRPELGNARRDAATWVTISAPHMCTSAHN